MSGGNMGANGMTFAPDCS